MIGRNKSAFRIDMVPGHSSVEGEVNGDTRMARFRARQEAPLEELTWPWTDWVKMDRKGVDLVWAELTKEEPTRGE